MVAKKKQTKESKKGVKKSIVSKKKFSFKLDSKNIFWVIFSMVLLLFIAISLIFGFFGFHSSAQKVGKNFVNYVNSQGSVNATYVSAKSFSKDLFEVIVLIKDKKVPVYITKDGRHFVQIIFPIEKNKSNALANSSSSPTKPSSQTQTNIPKSDKPTVDLFVMSYCPFGTQAEKGIIPALEALNNSVNFNLRFVYYSMHTSNGEIPENLNEYCIQQTQKDKLIPYLKCFLGSENGTSCLDKVGIDMDQLNSCKVKTDKEYNVTYNLKNKASWLNGRFPLFSVDKDLNTKYGVQGSPTLIVNGVKVNSGRDPESFLKEICSAFSTQPDACSKQLSTTAYGPGFGYSTSGSSNNAQCA